MRRDSILILAKVAVLSGSANAVALGIVFQSWLYILVGVVLLYDWFRTNE